MYGASPFPWTCSAKLWRPSNVTSLRLRVDGDERGDNRLPPEDHDPDGNARMRSCGKPDSSVELRVIDADGSYLPPGRVGEIICRSTQNMKGYGICPKDCAPLFVGSGCKRARRLSGRGWYYYIRIAYERHDHLRGLNIYPAEVESVCSPPRRRRRCVDRGPVIRGAKR